jgi:hypothetical protein
MDLGEILSKAWKMIWKNKILWLFGFLASCGVSGRTAGVGGGGGSSTVSTQPASFDAPNFLTPSTQRAFEDFFQTLADIPVWLWIFIALGIIIGGFILSVLLQMLGTMGTTGVIKGTSMADEAAEDDKPLSFSEIFKGLKPYYWKVFLFNIGFRIAGFLVIFILFLPIVILAICTCGLGIFVLIPIGWFISVMVYFTQIAIIEEDLGIFDAIKRSWNVIIKNLGQAVLMFLILGIGQLVAALVISLPLLISIVPLLVNLIATGFSNLTAGFVISAITFLGTLPLMLFLNGVLQAYVIASWTLTFRRLTADDKLSPKVISKEDEK